MSRTATATVPSAVPTDAPTDAPSAMPTPAPIPAPTAVPTAMPTAAPTPASAAVPAASPRFAVVRCEPERTARPAPRIPAPRAHRGTPLVPGSVRAGAREAAARRRAELVIRITLEVFGGHRPVAHLGPYAAPEVLRYVGAGLPRRGAEATGPAQATSLHCHLVGRAAAEVVAVCRFGGSRRALAARLDLTPTGHWRCTALRVL